MKYCLGTRNGVLQRTTSGGISENVALKEKIHLHKAPPPPPYFHSHSGLWISSFHNSFCMSVKPSHFPSTTNFGCWGGGGGFTIRRPPTMAEILGFVGAKLKKCPPPLLHRAVIPSIRTTTQHASCFQRRDHTRRKSSQTGLPQGPNRHLKHAVTKQ